ncbi:Pentatricopeptide repeat-containing protein [Artemisia annua]|uniref:Pentatricopeptide repeat-containing protein n=1 Tax=Artemisia annua TaxID=35608 RepID=A0A2U1LZ11_ARTAN|nr:Pentatricopeptide repeat-containing protein [Artemisia annua]
MSSTSKSNQQKAKKSKLTANLVHLWEVEEQTRNWLELPSDIMTDILFRIGVKDMLQSAQKVCTTWRKICKDPSICRVLHLDGSKRSFREPVTITFQNAVDRSQGQLIDLTMMNYDDGQLITYVADRSSQLRRLEVAFCYGNLYESMLKCFKKFSLLGELSLHNTVISERIVEKLGRHCPLLKILRGNQKPDAYWDEDWIEDQVAVAIGENLPGLTHLELIGNNMSNYGLKEILDGCSHLELLDLRGCFYIELKGAIRKRCKKIKCLKMPRESLEGCSYIYKDFTLSDGSYWSTESHFDANGQLSSSAVICRMNGNTMPRHQLRCLPSVGLLNCLVSVLCKRKEGLVIVPQVLVKSRLMNIRIDESSFVVLIKGLCRFRKAKSAVGLLCHMFEYGIEIDRSCFSLVLSTLCRFRDNVECGEVMGLVEEMRKLGFCFDRMDYVNVIRFLVICGKGLDALELLSEMKRDGFMPDVVCYTVVLDGVISIGEYECAERLFDEMLLCGLVLILILIMVSLIFYASHKLVEVIEPGLNVAFFLAMKCLPSVGLLNCLVSVLCKRKEGLVIVPQVLVKSRLMNIRIDESSFVVLIKGLCRFRKAKSAVGLLCHMFEYGIEIDRSCFSLVLSTLCRFRDNVECGEVMGLVEEMRKLGFCFDRMDYVNVIRFLVICGKGMDALELLSEMKRDGFMPDVVCYTVVLDGVISIGEYECAERLFDEMLLCGLVPDINTYNVYVNGLCKQKKFDNGIMMLSCMEEIGCKPNTITYNTILSAIYESGEIGLANDFLAQVRRKGVMLNSRTYEIMICRMVDTDYISKALDLLEEMVDKRLLPQSATFDDVLCKLCQKGLVSKALNLLTEMLGKNVIPGCRSWKALLVELQIKHAYMEIDFSDMEITSA